MSPARVDDLALKVEAMLFASGKPMSVHDIADALGASDPRPILQAVRGLVQAYEGRQTALEVRRVGEKFALKLREEFAPAAHGVTPVEMAPRTLRTLTLIAYHQPILQSRLARMLGDMAYEEVGRLRGLGLVRGDPRGATLELRTTRAFAEYFGIPSTKPEEIRQYLERKLGVTAQSLQAPIGAVEPPDPESVHAEEPPVPAADSPRPPEGAAREADSAGAERAASALGTTPASP